MDLCSRLLATGTASLGGGGEVQCNTCLCGRALFPKVVFSSPSGRERLSQVAAGAVVHKQREGLCGRLPLFGA